MSKPPLTIHQAYQFLLHNKKLSPNPPQAALVTRLSQLQISLTQQPLTRHAPRGLYIHGAVGTGKSRLADLFAATTAARRIPTRRVHFHEFMLEVHARLHSARTSPAAAAGRGADALGEIGRQVGHEVRILCLDEFQVTDIADAMILRGLFGGMWESGVVVVATGNRHPSELYARGLNRGLVLPFIAELQRRCAVWRLSGGRDYRRREQEHMPVFFTETRGFEDALLEAIDGNELKPVMIPVRMKRRLHVLACGKMEHGMVVRSTFQDLCEANLGSAEYHALCKARRTIFISGLRKFQAHELDFVQRLVTFVDIAYESKTRLVCLSTVPLTEMFVNIVPKEGQAAGDSDPLGNLTIRGEGGSSSSMMSTFIGDIEWSATGLQIASLAAGGAGESDVKFAIERAISRLFEMGAKSYPNPP
jgi:protein AFG1